MYTIYTCGIVYLLGMSLFIFALCKAARWGDDAYRKAFIDMMKNKKK